MPTHWAPGLRCLVPLAFLWTCSTALPAGGIAVERIAAELPPGFDIRGPDDDMNCSAIDNTRAAFAVMTPEMRAAQHEQMGMQYWKNWDDSLLAAETGAWEEGDREMMEGVRDLHDQMDQLQAALRSQAGGTQEIEDEDERKLTSLRLEFTGSNQGRECALSLYTTLPAPGPQIVTDFRLGVYTADLLDFQRKLASGTVPDLFAMDETPRRSFWGVCDQTMDCP